MQWKARSNSWSSGIKHEYLMVFFNSEIKKKEFLSKTAISREKNTQLLYLFHFLLISFVFSHFFSWHRWIKKSLFQLSLKPEIFLQWIGNLFVPYQPSVSKSSCYKKAMPSHFKDFSEQQSYPVISSRLVSSRAGHCSMTHFEIERRG